MTPNEKTAHADAYAATRRLRRTRDKTQRIYVAARDDHNAAVAEFQEGYETIYELTLAKLESNGDN